MKWNNVLKDELPTHQEEVVISVRGVNYRGKFCATGNHFEIENSGKSTFFKATAPDIYWREVQGPEANNIK